VPIPTLIVKAASDAYPGLTANEYVCLRAATLAGIYTPTFDLSHDGNLLVLERFDAVQKADGSMCLPVIFTDVGADPRRLRETPVRVGTHLLRTGFNRHRQVKR